MTKQEKQKQQSEAFFTRSVIDVQRTLEYTYECYINYSVLMGEYKKNFYDFRHPKHRALYEKFHNEEVKFSEKAARIWDLINQQKKSERLNYDVNV